MENFCLFFYPDMLFILVLICKNKQSCVYVQLFGKSIQLFGEKTFFLSYLLASFVSISIIVGHHLKLICHIQCGKARI